MSKINGEPYVINVMEKIANERKRLEKNVRSPLYEMNPQWRWMENWLAKTNEEHYEEDDVATIEPYCYVCGKKNKFLARMDFSFCHEYGCEMQICKDCLDKMSKMIADRRDIK